MSRTRPNNKRDELTTAALRLFAEKGIRGTSVRDIADAAGVTEGALYRHFAGKDMLAQSLFAECARMLYEHLDGAVSDVSGASQQLCALARGFLEFADTQPEAYEYVMARHHESVGELPADQPLPKDVFVRVIEQGVTGGELRPLDHQLGAAMMIGLLVRTVFFMQRGLIDMTPENITAEVCGAVQRIFLTRQTLEVCGERGV
jgi:AcrR family transcriptional regulator